MEERIFRRVCVWEREGECYTVAVALLRCIPSIYPYMCGISVGIRWGKRESQVVLTLKCFNTWCFWSHMCAGVGVCVESLEFYQYFFLLTCRTKYKVCDEKVNEKARNIKSILNEFRTDSEAFCWHRKRNFNGNHFWMIWYIQIWNTFYAVLIHDASTYPLKCIQFTYSNVDLGWIFCFRPTVHWLVGR